MWKDVNNRFPKIQNVDKNQPGRTKIIDLIVERQLIRVRQDVEKWRRALIQAEDVLTPDRTQLIKVYKDVILDGHITGIISSIKNKIKSKGFSIVGEDVKKDEEKTKLFETQWFFKFLDFVVEAPFWGFTLVQLGDIINDGFEEIDDVPREHVVPDLNLVKRELRITVSTKSNGFDYTAPQNKDWFIFIGEKKDMGLLNAASPHALSKKNLFIEMWEYGEIFGMPLRVGQTDIRDEARRKNMETMLSTMGSAAWGVFDKEDNVTFRETQQTDPADVFISPIKLSNEEISKGFAGQVAVFDEKAFTGSAEVQERLFAEFIKSFMRQARFVINDELIPRMVTHGILPSGFTFRWDVEDTVTVIEGAKMIKDIAPFFTIPPEEVEKFTSIKVENNKTLLEETEVKSVMKKVAAYYKV